MTFIVELASKRKFLNSSIVKENSTTQESWLAGLILVITFSTDPQLGRRKSRWKVDSIIFPTIYYMTRLI